MSLLNHSIGPTGQPAFPLKVSTTQDSCHNVQMVLPLPGTSSLRACQSSSKKKASVTIASAASQPGQSVYGASHVEQKNDILAASTNTICNLTHLIKYEQNQPEHGVKSKISSVCSVEFQPFTSCFMNAFVQNSRFSMIDVGKEVDEQSSFKPRDVLLVSVASAVKLDDAQIDLISRKMERLTGFRKLRLENTIDPSLLAGFVISYCNDGSHVVDLSVKGQLATLAARLESSDQRSCNNVHSWSSPNYQHELKCTTLVLNESEQYEFNKCLEFVLFCSKVLFRDVYTSRLINSFLYMK